MNALTHRSEFEAALSHYSLSEAAKQTLAHTKLVILTGPSSSGRNTIINDLLTTGRYHFIISDTTRRPRPNNGVMEQNGREYWFRKEVDMLADIQAGNFLEAAIIHNQQVSGISIRELATAAEQSKTPINEIEIQGTQNVHALKPDGSYFFVVPPSFDEWMFRMRGRGELPADEVRRRLQSAVNEISVALGQNYLQFIVNDTYKHAARHIDEVVMGTSTTKDDTAIRSLASQIVADTKSFLAGP